FFVLLFFSQNLAFLKKIICGEILVIHQTVLRLPHVPDTDGVGAAPTVALHGSVQVSGKLPPTEAFAPHTPFVNGHYSVAIIGNLLVHDDETGWVVHWSRHF
ncbi:MAG: hypothetical protein AAB905_00120, partial [Patescibacteria group bacterium]